MDSTGVGYFPVAGSREHSTCSRSVTGGKFLERLAHRQLLRSTVLKFLVYIYLCVSGFLPAGKNAVSSIVGRENG